jgi:hypothetical protein
MSSFDFSTTFPLKMQFPLMLTGRKRIFSMFYQIS